MKKEFPAIRKMLRRAASLTLAVSMLAGATLSSGCSTTPKKELNLFIWTEYISDSVISDFEKEFNCKVNMTTYSSNEDLLSKVKGSNEGIYDVVVPSDYMVKMMTDEGLLQKLDQTKLTNLSNMNSTYMNQYYDKGNQYSIPYLGGAVVICVNTKKVTDNITSFSQLLDPKYKDSLVLLDDFRMVIGETARSLGYSMNTTDDTELAATAEKLKLLKPNIKLLDSDSPKTSMLNGETSIGYIWSAEGAICTQESSDFKLIYPSEGTYLFLDNMCILKGAKNPELANEFINFIMRPAEEKKILEAYPYASPNAAAVALMPDTYKNSIGSNIPSDVIANGQYCMDIGTNVDKYDALWTTFTQ